ncbi:sigma 54-interacting transcriptional regulator [Polyangium sp. 15x6]|uniref:sigma-54-dependent transcriptional regulator n=1 Tax=Polyangium sp. 15x6 TaxID=3042687 RepID=UPI00249BBE8F|nr:sigma 54-interacting transcriptional regulator [Polyangium sp. 15x6]MDI3287798.1 sigma 54-interacting transcriptional regulator [Polyangium sp. 15x6]
MAPKQLRSFIARLYEAKHFEDAAFLILREALDVAKRALSKSPFVKHGRVLRGMVHLRPADGYQRLVVVDEPSPRPAGSASPMHLPSASAWRWVARRVAPVAIDVPLGRVRVFADGNIDVVAEGGFLESESMQRLTSREASHLLAVPIRSMRGVVEGMATVEIGCPRAVGEDFIFAAVSEELQILADVASPYLVGLPLRPASTCPTDDLLPVVGPAMAALVEMLRIFAQQEETLLIGGPTGAGKSRLALWCHAQSPRRDGPFEVLDLITVPEDLQMAELCGWRKGAFTGAARDAPGAVARALRGTLFIDEIDKLSLKAQAGLLRLLETRKYRTLGDTGREQSADVRFIVGSNANLLELVEQGRFREDLYYRVNVLPVKLPSLDERRDEISQWACFMALRRHRESVPNGHIRVAAGVDRLLCERTWPGNLRQLDNVVRRAYALALMSQGATATEIVLEERHFIRALGYEAGGGRRSLLESMRSAAAAFVEEAERLEERGLGLDLDHGDAFRGFILGTAVERLGNRESAFRMLGKAQQVQSRNHHKMLRRELEKVDALCKAIREEDTKLFSALSDDES